MLNGGKYRWQCADRMNDNRVDDGKSRPQGTALLFGTAQSRLISSSFSDWSHQEWFPSAQQDAGNTGTTSETVGSNLSL